MRTLLLGIAIALGMLFTVSLLPRQTNAQSGYSPPLPVPYTVINSTGVTVVKAGAGTFYGVISPGVQLNALSCYDNASAASGQLLYSKVVPIALNDEAEVGVQFVNGLTCQQAVSIVGTELVLAR